jgi:hypothetical protein
VKNTKASTATVLAMQEDAKTGVTFEPKVHHGALSVIAGLVLLLVGGAGAYLAYTRYLAGVAPVVVFTAAPVPIFVDEREQIAAAEPAQILQSIERSLAKELPQNSVRLLYIDESTTTESIFSSLQLPAPDVLLRNVHNVGSIAGIINADGAQSPFFILSVASYGDTFAGMLSWEPTMPGDLGALFPPYAPTGTTTPIASAATSSAAIFSVFFHDEVVNNHDVRMYRDAEGRSILLYGYWDQRTLVIARDPAAFAELVARLATSRTP